MGSVKVKPTLVHDHTVDQWYKYVPSIAAYSSSHTFRRLGPYESEPDITGEIRIQITFEQSKVAFFSPHGLVHILNGLRADSQNDL